MLCIVSKCCRSFLQIGIEARLCVKDERRDMNGSHGKRFEACPCLVGACLASGLARSRPRTTPTIGSFSRLGYCSMNKNRRKSFLLWYLQGKRKGNIKKSCIIPGILRRPYANLNSHKYITIHPSARPSVSTFPFPYQFPSRTAINIGCSSMSF